MMNQELLHAYSLFYKRSRHPDVVGNILDLMYTRNQKYFTTLDLELLLSADHLKINNALKLLVDHGEVAYRMTQKVGFPYEYYLNLEGMMLSFERALKSNHLFTELLERTLEARDDSNLELNEFLKSAIVFNSEMLDVVHQKIEEYFPLKKSKS